jgi:uncharacterized iron-regulated membrane protein
MPPLTSMPSLWHKWVHRPQSILLRRALFQIHLWVALTIGVYVVVISLSGSAIVFRREFNQWLVPRTVAAVGVRMTEADLRSAAQRAYPEHTIAEIREQRRPERPVLVSLERRGSISERLFDPYTGDDLGHAYPPVLRFVEWLVDLHDNLLAGSTGRIVNGVGGFLVMALLLTGAVIWWPGKAHWRRSLVVRAPFGARGFVWHLHSFIGFWAFALLLIWASTAVYFAFPEPFEGAIDRFDDDLNDLYRPGEAVLLALIKLHFGRFGGLEIRVLWALLGLLPAALFITGFIMWWRRVLRPAWVSFAARAPQALPEES